MKTLPIHKASSHLESLVDAAVAGEEVIITKDSQTAVKLVPIPTPGRPRPQFGSAKDLISMSDDFDAPLDDFNDYTE
jgi:prevent-host-death family protein